MDFKLCYKVYEYKPNLAAIKKFKEATGLDLWGVLSKYTSVFIQATRDNSGVSDMLHKLSEVLSFVDAAQLFYCLAKQCSNSVTIEEIEDAMFHAGIHASDSEHDMSEPYTIILYKVALDISKYHETLRAETKKP